MRQLVVVAALLLALAACQKTGTAPESAAVAAGDADFAAKLHERLLDAKPGDVIEIPAGKFSFDRSLTLRADGVTTVSEPVQSRDHTERMLTAFGGGFTWGAALLKGSI